MSLENAEQVAQPEATPAGHAFGCDYGGPDASNTEAVNCPLIAKSC